MHGHEPARRWSEEPIGAQVSLGRSRGGLEVIPGGYDAARGASALVDHDSQETSAALATVRDGSLPRTQLLRAAAFLLLEAIADDLSGDPALPAELAGLLAGVKRSAPPPAGPLWPSEPLTQSETRVLRYLPTHLGTPEIAAELFVSANTVKTHLQHLYRKLGAHSRREAVQRARAIGLLAGSSGRPQNAGLPRHT